jgi:hypothetical protein
MQLPEQIIDSVQRDVLLYEAFLHRVATQVIARGISQFPIFVAHREPNLGIGKNIIDAEQMNTDWNINASLLEEFTAKNIVQNHKIVSFKQVYKNPQEFACIFIVSGNNDAGFAFYPYRRETENNP